MKLRILAFVLSVATQILLCGCTTVDSLSDDVMLEGVRQQYDEMLSPANRIYKLDYLVDGVPHRYETYYQESSNRHYSLLFEKGVLLGVGYVSTQEAHWPKIRDCTLFPLDEKLNVKACFKEIDDKYIARTYNKLNGYGDVHFDSKKVRTIDAFLEILMFSPAVVAASVVTLPVLVLDGAYADAKKREFQFSVGDSYKKIESYILELPKESKDFHGGNGSVYIRHGVMGFPAIAFGVYDGQIVWIDKNPKGVCSGGFLGFGQKCGLLKNFD